MHFIFMIQHTNFQLYAASKNIKIVGALKGHLDGFSNDQENKKVG